MTPKSWAQESISEFFKCRSSPTQTQCNQTVLSISGASDVRPVQIQGSLSYTVLCKDCPGQQQELIVSFRGEESGLNDHIVKLAKGIHGSLVPESKFQGIVSGAAPPLAIYSMPYLSGISCLKALIAQEEMDSKEEAKQMCYIKSLARHFAQCWSKPQIIDVQVQAQHQARIHQRLTILRESLLSIIPSSVISELEDSLPILFSDDYPQVLTHGDLTISNILVDDNTYEITGIVDWSLAAVLPFGMELVLSPGLNS